MATQQRHLIAALSLAALAAICFFLVAWALKAGSVVEAFPGGGSRLTGGSANFSSSNPSYNRVITRVGNPGRYWFIVGLLGAFGSLLAVVAVLEHRSYRISSAAGGHRNLGPALLAKLDRACRLYPERQETLVHARSVSVDLNNPHLDTVLDDFLEKILKAPNREVALKEIQNLARALNLAGRF